MAEKERKEFKKRQQRVLDAVALKEPDRVPIIPFTQAFPMYYAGVSIQEAMNEFDKCAYALDKFYAEFKPDLGWDPILMYPAKFMEFVGVKWFRWPGYGIDDPEQMYQYLEGEYMKEDEYDELLFDPTQFMLQKWLPRSVEVFEGLKDLSFRSSMWFGFFGSIGQFGNKEVQKALKKLMEASAMLQEWNDFIAEYDEKMENEFEVPVAYGALGWPPFDMLGDTMRGSYGILTDMYDRPEKILAVLEKFTKMAIDNAIAATDASGRKIVFIALHKGIDSFMSKEFFAKFYWPTLQEYLVGLIEADLLPHVYVEGAYNTRLDFLKDIPKGKVIYNFETTDMFTAKKELGDIACIAGNVPNDMLMIGTPEEVDEYCKRLIGECGQGGGFMLDSSALIDNAKPENVRAMFESIEKYGIY